MLEMLMYGKHTVYKIWRLMFPITNEKYFTAHKLKHRCKISINYTNII